MKHWRQDWIYQNTDLYIYDKNDKWFYVSLDKKDVRGQWTQKVYQVDSPRYEDLHPGLPRWKKLLGKYNPSTPAKKRVF